MAASHELAEMLVDPGINLWCAGPKGRMYAYEVCDAVEEEEFLVDGIPMCNFVYPAYFDLFRTPKSVQFDHNNDIGPSFPNIAERLRHGARERQKEKHIRFTREEGALQERETRRSSQRAPRRLDDESRLIQRAFQLIPSKKRRTGIACGSYRFAIKREADDREDVGETTRRSVRASDAATRRSVLDPRPFLRVPRLIICHASDIRIIAMLQLNGA